MSLHKKPSVLHITTGDAWDYPIHKFTAKGFRDEVQSQFKYETQRNAFKQQAETKWVQLFKQHGIKPGDFVHDAPRMEKGFAIRCLVNPDYSLKDIAIVGDMPNGDMPQIFIGGDKPSIHYGYHIERCHKGESHTWDNRPEDFAELRGDTSWQGKPINETAMTKLIIDEEVMTRHRRYNEMHKALDMFRYNKIDFNEVQQLLKSIS